MSKYGKMDTNFEPLRIGGEEVFRTIYLGWRINSENVFGF